MTHTVNAMTGPGEIEPSAAESPHERVLVLGASNVARGLIDIAELVRGGREAPIDLVVAAGHGRSLGARSSGLWRSLPGLTQCGLWQALSSRPKAQRTSAIITDVGNDLLYGQSPETVVGWLEQCVLRLCETDCRLIMTELPLASLKGVGRIRFWTARRVLFPSSPLAFEGFIDKCSEVNDGLRLLAERFGATCCLPEPSWYGLDPVHIKGREQRRAWSQVLAPWNAAANQQVIRYSKADRSRLRAVRHASREWFGQTQTRSQPAAILSDGSLVSMY